MIPYSMALWTILTKWPAPCGPQWSQPRSAVLLPDVRPGVGGAAASPGASASNTGRMRETTSASPPTIRQKPRSSPNTPPLTPQST